MKRVSMIASGRVQGVGFRAYVQDIAIDMCIHGWVRNLQDGTVEIEAEGPEEKIIRFINIIQNSRSRVIFVENLKIREISPTNDYEFVITR